MRVGDEVVTTPALRLGLLAAVVALTLWTGSPLPAGEPVYLGDGATKTVLMDEGMVPSSYQQWLLAFGYAPTGPGNLDCRFQQKLDGRVVRGNTVRADPLIVYLDTGQEVADPPAKSRRLEPFGIATWGVPDLSYLADGQEPTVAVGVEVTTTGPHVIDEFSGHCVFKAFERCVRDAWTLCIGGNGRRFKAEWWVTTGGQTRQARVWSNGRNDGWFYVFDSSVPDAWIKVHNNCRTEAAYYVEIDVPRKLDWYLLLTDTQAGETRRYEDVSVGLNRRYSHGFSTCP